jgi:hypothetical protein
MTAETEQDRRIDWDAPALQPGVDVSQPTDANETPEVVTSPSTQQKSVVGRVATGRSWTRGVWD